VTGTAGTTDARPAAAHPSRSRWVYWTAAAVSVFVLSALGSALSKRPWCDEAWFASPALDLVENGRMGPHLLDPTGSHLSILIPGARLERINERTYWVMPVYLFVLALTIKIFGFGLFVVRLPALIWGLVALAAWYVIVRWLGGSRELASLTVFLIGIDYAFVNAGSDGRMDMMCAALGFLALAIYLVLRETRLALAVLLAHTVAALSLSTHPNGALASAALVVYAVVFGPEAPLVGSGAPHGSSLFSGGHGVGGFYPAGSTRVRLAVRRQRGHTQPGSDSAAGIDPTGD